MIVCPVPLAAYLGAQSDLNLVSTCGGWERQVREPETKAES